MNRCQGWNIYYYGPEFLKDSLWVPPDQMTSISIAATAGGEMEEENDEENAPVKIPSSLWLLL